MTLEFFSDLLELIAWVFTHFPPLLWVLAMAIICSCVNVIRYLVGGRSIG